MKVLRNYEVVLLELEDGSEIMVKKEYLKNKECNLFIYKHIESETDGKFEDNYEYRDCMFSEGDIAICDALRRVFPDLV